MQKVIFRKIGVKSYKPGRSVLLNKKKVIKLSANESALGFSPRVKKNYQKLICYLNILTQNLKVYARKFQKNLDVISTR